MGGELQGALKWVGGDWSCRARGTWRREEIYGIVQGRPGSWRARRSLVGVVAVSDRARSSQVNSSQVGRMGHAWPSLEELAPYSRGRPPHRTLASMETFFLEPGPGLHQVGAEWAVMMPPTPALSGTPREGSQCLQSHWGTCKFQCRILNQRRARHGHLMILQGYQLRQHDSMTASKYLRVTAVSTWTQARSSRHQAAVCLSLQAKQYRRRSDLEHSGLCDRAHSI